MKKQDMAAEQLVVGTGWLPALTRAMQERAEQPQADTVALGNPDAYSVAAE